ncbi:MAG: family 16 glycosylhydrolase [Spirochaetales bacterium]|nr:family 16 glycosylhydrolase [Spirochaetales bacterium]
MRKRLGGILLILSLALAFVFYSCQSADDVLVKEDDVYKLVWNDEFDGPDIDQTKWNVVNAGGGFGNSELQYYTSRKENARIEGGKLVFEARKELHLGHAYTSAMLITEGKEAWKYGKFVIKAKMPIGQGIWPAFWFMPVSINKDREYGGWPSCGELDMVEMIGNEPYTVHGTLHYGVPHVYTGTQYHLPKEKKKTFNDDYHVFTLEWEPGEIRWFVDGNLYLTQNDWFAREEDNAADFTFPAPFDQDFFLKLNLAVGGQWPGNPDSKTKFPQQMLIDYVRVYQKKAGYPVIIGKPKKEKSDEPEKAEKLQPLRKPRPDGNMIYNGTFDNLKQVKKYELISAMPDDYLKEVEENGYWQFMTGFGGSGTNVVENGVFKVNINSIGNQSYSLQLIQPPLYMKKGVVYRIRFDAKADFPRPIMVKVTQVGGQWQAYSGMNDVDIGKEWETHNIYFKMNHPTDNRARVEFNFGLHKSSVYIDNVVISPFDLSDAEKVILPNKNYIYNSTFDQGDDRMIFWHLNTSGDAKAEKSVGNAFKDRELTVKIDNPGKAAGDIQVVQTGLTVYPGKQYITKFKARAAAERKIEVVIIEEETRKVISRVPVTLGTEMKDYSFDMKLSTVPKGKVTFAFSVGGDPASVVIDDVWLREKD